MWKFKRMRRELKEQNIVFSDHDKKESQDILWEAHLLYLFVFFPIYLLKACLNRFKSNFKKNMCNKMLTSWHGYYIVIYFAITAFNNSININFRSPYFFCWHAVLLGGNHCSFDRDSHINKNFKMIDYAYIYTPINSIVYWCPFILVWLLIHFIIDNQNSQS